MQTTLDIEQIIKTQTPLNGRKQETQRASAVFASKGVKDHERAEFCVQLAVMLRARVSLLQAVEILGQQAKHRKMKEVAGRLAQEMRRGNSFARALTSCPDVFDQLFIVTAEVGEETGELARVLGQLAVYLDKIAALKKKFAQALVYPALVLTVAVLTVIFLLLFIVPSFAEMFKSFQMEPPASTEIVLTISKLLENYGLYLFAGLVALLVFLQQAMKGQRAREIMEQGLFKLPFVGGILLNNLVARFCRTLGTLLQSQVSLVDALTITRKVFTNKRIREEIGVILHRVKQGRAVAEQLYRSALFPPMVAHMITVGEETSELDAMLLKVADYFEKEIDGKVETLASVIEPVIVIFLGLLVAGILISMYLPLFDLVTALEGI